MMQIEAQRGAKGESGYALLVTSVFSALTLFVLAGALGWTMNNLRMVARNNQYFRTVAAAEAATEAVLGRLESDYQSGGDAAVQANLSSYRLSIPRASDSPIWSGYVFADDLGQTGQIQVASVSLLEFRELASQYHGLKGYSSTYRIIADAREQASSFNFGAGVQQNVETATVPLFQFAIFYNMDLEIDPGPNMTITGPVHSNGTVYSQPQATLTFQGNVTAAGSLVADKSPSDPTVRTPGRIIYNAEHDGNVSSLTMPIGTNNSPNAVRQVVEIPPSGESLTSPMGQQRFYNQADLIIKVTDGGVTATSGVADNCATTIPASQVNLFVNPGATFFNKRENATVHAVEIDVSKLRQWNATNTVLRPNLALGDVRILYVDDQRTETSSTESGVRLVNGDTILPQGLTVVSPNPVYIQGYYNAPVSARGTSDTSQTLPASIIADAITVLSPGWNDASSSLGLSSRMASDVTVNAAFLAGIVETTSGSYSGGVENFPRFLEDWTGKTFTYNGSMVVMYDSVYATGLWRGTGSSIGIYNPPIRNWAFDLNFSDPAKIPPGTPSVRVLVRDSWATLKPSVTF
jgi:hypothetical protein